MRVTTLAQQPHGGNMPSLITLSHKDVAALLLTAEIVLSFFFFIWLFYDFKPRWRKLKKALFEKNGIIPTGFVFCILLFVTVVIWKDGPAVLIPYCTGIGILTFATTAFM